VISGAPIIPKTGQNGPKIRTGRDVTFRYPLATPCVRIVVASVFHKNITGSGKLDISEALS